MEVDSEMSNGGERRWTPLDAVSRTLRPFPPQTPPFNLRLLRLLRLLRPLRILRLLRLLEILRLVRLGIGYSS